MRIVKQALSLLTLLTAAIFTTSPAFAELIWDRESGQWRVEGGVIGAYFGDEINAKNALELMNIAGQAQQDGDYFQALRVYARVYEDYPNSIFAPEAYFQSGKIRIERNQFDDAFEQFNEIVKRYPDYPKFNQVIGQQFETASQLMEGNRPYYWGLVPGFRDYTAAMQFFEGVVDNAPYSRYAPVALMNIALIAQKRDETEKAIDALDRLITNYPDSVLAPNAYLTLAQTFASLVNGAYYDQGATREAISYYEDFLILFPESENISEAEVGLQEMKDTMARSKFLIGDFYWRYRSNTEAARVFLNAAVDAAPESSSAAQAKALLERIDNGEKPPGTPIDFLFPDEEDTVPEYQKNAPAKETVSDNTDEEDKS